MPTITIGNDCKAIDLRAVHPAPYGFRDATQVQRLVFHHDAASWPSNIRSRTAEQDRIAGVHRHHQDLGWPGIAYHFFLFPHRIYYTGDWATVRYHTGGPDDPNTPQVIGRYNEDGIAICLAGDFTDHSPSERQLAKAALLVRNLRFLFSRTDLPIFAHRDLTNTACPGDTWPRWAPRITGN